MKKALAMALAVCTLLVLLCACNSNPGTTSDPVNQDQVVNLPNKGGDDSTVSDESAVGDATTVAGDTNSNATTNKNDKGNSSKKTTTKGKDSKVTTTLPNMSVVAPSKNIDLTNHDFGGVTIKRIVWYTLGKDEKQMLSEFTKKYNVKVQDVVVDYENINDKLAASMTSGDVIDVGFLFGAFFPAQVIANMYMQIDSYIKRDYMVDSSSSASLAKGGFDMKKMDYFKWNGHYYGFSSYWDVDILVMYYNKRMFQAADVKTPLEHVKAGTWNLDTFYEAAAALTDVDAGTYGWSAGGENTGTGRGTFVNSYGTNIIKYDSNGKPQQNLGDANVLKGLQFMQKMYYGAGKVVDGSATFYNGKAAMCADGLYMSPKLMTNASVPDSVKNNWEIAPFPMAKGHENDPYPADWLKSFGILRGSKNPDAAAAYAYYRTKYKMDNLYDEYMTDAQKELVRPLYTDVNYQCCSYGDLNTKYGEMAGLICEGGDIAQAISENKSVFQAQIDRVLKG